MDKSAILEKLAHAVLNCDPDVAKESAQQAIKMGIDPLKALEEGLARGLRELGEKFEREEVFLAHLVMGAEAMQAGIEVLEPRIPKEKRRRAIGKIVIGTVQGDIHDIGKNIVIAVLRAAGFEVYDLGKDVPVERFIDKLKEVKPDILGLSALMPVTMPYQKEVIEALKQCGLREKVKVMVGGAPVSEKWANEIGADGYADNAIDAVRIAKKLVGA